MINWRVRIRSKTFWVALVPALLLLVQAVAALFGYQWDFAGLSQQLMGIVNAAFAVMSILGVVADPTTEGIGDSARALGYDEPAPAARHMGGAGNE